MEDVGVGVGEAFGLGVAIEFEAAALLLAEQGFEVVGVGADDSFQDSAVEVPSPGRADGVTPPPASSAVAG